MIFKVPFESTHSMMPLNKEGLVMMTTTHLRASSDHLPCPPGATPAPTCCPHHLPHHLYWGRTQGQDPLYNLCSSPGGWHEALAAPGSRIAPFQTDLEQCREANRPVPAPWGTHRTTPALSGWHFTSRSTVDRHSLLFSCRAAGSLGPFMELPTLSRRPTVVTCL